MLEQLIHMLTIGYQSANGTFLFINTELTFIRDSFVKWR
jgi:hypothetical protein